MNLKKLNMRFPRRSGVYTGQIHKRESGLEFLEIGVPQFEEVSKRNQQVSFKW